MDDTREKIALLREYFEKRDDVVMAFIFGSRASDRAHEGSDWDIAVYFVPEGKLLEWEESGRSYPQEDRVWGDCIEMLGTDNVDLLVLNRAPSSIADTALKGAPLVVKDQRLWRRFMLVITGEAHDYRQFAEDFYAISERSRSLTPQDREILWKTIKFVEEQFCLYEYFTALSEKEYVSDIHKRNDVERWVENLVNAGIDIAKIILASRKKPIPATYRETMKEALWALGFDDAFADRCAGWIKLRNILAHEYLDIKWRKIEDFIRGSSDHFRQYAEAVKRALAEENG